MSELVRYRTADGVATVTLDSPHNRNALSSALMRSVREHIAAAGADEQVRVIVLEHTGTVFCSGMDLTESAGRSADAMPVNLFPALLQDLWEAPKPVLAGVGGAVRAGGLGLLGACDIVVAAASATFAFAEVRRGLVPATLVPTVLPQLSPTAARELFLTGATFGAERAAAIGLVTCAVPDPDLAATIARYAETLQANGPTALRTTRALVRGPFPASDLAAMQQVSARQFAGAEGQEGIAAFTQKREPRWR